MGSELHMSVSQVFAKKGEKYAFVSFADGERMAEGKIPDCKITSSRGFTEDEVSQLERYMKQELPALKKMASGIHALDGFLK